MAWFSNHYICERCDTTWTDEWSCMCDDDCRQCGARHMSPYDSDDLTLVIKERGSEFIVLRSPETAEHLPDYDEVATFPSREEASAYVVEAAYLAAEDRA